MTTTKTVTAKEVSELRQRTGAGMMDCKKALEESKGDMDAAIEALRKSGAAKAEKRVGRVASEGIIGSYIHHNGKVGVMVEVNCETDFVARTDEFKNLAKAIAEHIAGAPTSPLAVDKDQVPAERVEQERRIFAEQVKQSGKPENLVDKIVTGKIEAFYKDVTLLNQPWIRDDKKTIGEMVKEVSGKTGENIQIRRFARFKIGEAD
jgi:elongation factor Ts